jgi:hypothetical protein
MNIAELVTELQRLRDEYGGEIEVWAAPGFIPEMKVTDLGFADAGQLPTLRTICPRDYDYPPRIILDLKDPAP